MTKKFLERAYGHKPGREAVAFYNEWADTYDAELESGRYMTPVRCASALAEAGADLDTPTLDFGCGTGLSGEALKREGFTTVDGWDPTPEMLKLAEGRGVYRVLRQIEPDRPLFAPPNAYGAVNAVGVLSPGLAPPETFEQLLSFLPKGGLIAFSLNDHAIEDGTHRAHLEGLVAAGVVEVTFSEYGDHIPGTGLNAWVYVIRKL
ncbi:MAG: methyltransferase domain-containing protein [Pseudomonadota bacterium]